MSKTSSKITATKDSIFLGASGTRGVFDIVDHDKLVRTLGEATGAGSSSTGRNIIRKNF